MTSPLTIGKGGFADYEGGDVVLASIGFDVADINPLGRVRTRGLLRRGQPVWFAKDTGL